MILDHGAPTATVIMVEPVCRTREIPRNCGYVLCAVFPTKVLGAGIYSSVVFGGSMVLANAVELPKLCSSRLPLRSGATKPSIARRLLILKYVDLLLIVPRARVGFLVDSVSSASFKTSGFSLFVP